MDSSSPTPVSSAPMRAADLFRDPAHGGLSHTRLWANVACFISTGVIIWYAVNLVLTTEMLALYLFISTGVAGVSKWVSLTRNRRSGGGTRWKKNH